MAADHHQWQDMPITTVPMHAVRNTGPEQSCAAMKPGALCTQAMYHNGTLCTITHLIARNKYFVPKLLLMEGIFRISLQ